VWFASRSVKFERSHRKTLVKNNALARKIEKHVADLDIDEAAIYSHLAEALGELGVAAARRAGYPPGASCRRRYRSARLRMSPSKLLPRASVQCPAVDSAVDTPTAMSGLF
jgi:hypothetical protein